MFGGSNYSLSDIAAVTRDSNCCNNGSGGGFGNGWGEGAWFIWIILIFAIFGGWGNGGWGNQGGGGVNGSGFQGYATRADINEGFALNGIERGIQGIQQGICDSTYALNNAIQSGFANTNVAMMQGFNGVQSQMCNLGYQMQDCCCQTQRAIDGVNYNMAQNTCALQNTMHNNTRDIIDSQNAGTRAILDYLCQDKISTLQNENQSLKLAASQANQNAVLQAAMTANTAEIIRRTGNDCPIPAYVVPNPNCCYGNYGYGYGFDGNRCSGCGC